MWHQTTISAQRSTSLPIGEFLEQYLPIDQFFKDLLYSFGLASLHKAWLFDNEKLFGIAHVGYFTIIFLIIGIVQKFIKQSNNNELSSVKLSVFVIPAMIAILWATSWKFNVLIYSIPILNCFRWSFKIDLYLDFYLIVIATVILSHIITWFSWKEITKNMLIFFVIGIQLFNFLFIYVACPYKPFRYHGDDLPLKEEFNDKLTDGRIISIDFDKSKNNFTAPSLAFNYATLWGLNYFAAMNH